jgi:outer membrane receptor protein involved in Fe transport
MVQRTHGLRLETQKERGEEGGGNFSAQCDSSRKHASSESSQTRLTHTYGKFKNTQTHRDRFKAHAQTRLTVHAQMQFNSSRAHHASTQFNGSRKNTARRRRLHPAQTVHTRVQVYGLTFHIHRHSTSFTWTLRHQATHTHMQTTRQKQTVINIETFTRFTRRHSHPHNHTPPHSTRLSLSRHHFHCCKLSLSLSLSLSHNFAHTITH